MGPQRKKSKPNNKAATNQQRDDKLQQDGPPPASPLANLYDPPVKDQNKASTSAAKKDQKGKNQASSSSDKKADTDSSSIRSERRSSTASWYNGGSWRAKASPVAQATRESISVAGGATSEALAEGAGQVGRYMHNTLKRSSKSIPSLPSETRINATATTESDKDKTGDSSQGLTDIKTKKPKRKNTKTKETNMEEAASQQVKTKDEDTVMKDAPFDTVQEEPPLPPEPTMGTMSPPDTTQTASNSAQKGWFGWWSRPDGYNLEPEKATAADDSPDTETQAPSATPLPPTPAQPLSNPIEMPNATTAEPTTPIPIEAPANPGNNKYGSTRSWFGLWSNAQNTLAQPDESSTQPQQSPPDNAPPAEPAPNEQPQPEPELPSEPPATSSDEMQTQQPGESPQRQKSAGWAFWSREAKPDEAPAQNGTQRQVGELAVADTPSQSHPEAAQFNQERNTKTKSKRLSRTESLKETKNGRVTATAISNPETPSDSPPPSRPQTPEPGRPLDSTKATPAKALKSPSHPPHMVMPSFRETYKEAPVQTYWERVSQYVGSSLKLIDAQIPDNHVSIAPTFPKVKNAVAIGVHGYFPAPLIQKVLGPPTGTSIRFANHASAAIRAWTEKNQPDMPCDIETVALEGEGFIADRVNTLWKLLLNWLSHLRQADLIFVACHSQGVPVAVMLVSKLIQLGCLSPHAKIAICAMAGVNLGPFADYKSRLLGAGSAAELFEFSRPASKVSTEYASALDVVLRHGVRITYAGSIDDQLVSLESSTFSNLSHPYIYRCVFVDGRVHAPDFITHLVAFALKLRNLGISDHGLIRELSLPLAGSLYGGQGHSTIYDDPAVYDLALEFSLETTDVAHSASLTSPGTDAQTRRRSRGGPPSSVTAANAMRRGSMSAAKELSGIAPVIAPFEVQASGGNANPYFLPWALRGIVEEEIVKTDMSDGVKELVKLFEEWKPTSKVLKDVKFRCEAVRSKL